MSLPAYQHGDTCWNCRKTIKEPQESTTIVSIDIENLLCMKAMVSQCALACKQ